MAESVRTVKVAVTDLAENNKELRQRLDEAISRLDILIKDVHKRKVVQRQPTAKPKPRPAKRPPFHIDAIDVWDDVTYVAVSQSGRVAFLRQANSRPVGRSPISTASKAVSICRDLPGRTTPVHCRGKTRGNRIGHLVALRRFYPGIGHRRQKGRRCAAHDHCNPCGRGSGHVTHPPGHAPA